MLTKMSMRSVRASSLEGRICRTTSQVLPGQAPLTAHLASRHSHRRFNHGLIGPPTERELAISAHKPEDRRTLRAYFVRGGTSNGLIINHANLPSSKEDWNIILSRAMGSPDPFGRQLNGMGSGVSSTSKIMVLEPPSRDDVDLDYTFVQVGIKDGKLDMAGNCGNMSSAVGPVAWDWNHFGRSKQPYIEVDSDGIPWATVRLFNTNTSKVIVSKFKVDPTHGHLYDSRGDYTIDGVPGTGSKITMSFMDPAGAKTGKALPTGNPIDTLELADGFSIQASLVDVSNPGVFVAAKDLGLTEATTPETIEADSALKARLEEIRRAGASKMGLDPDVESIPKILVLFDTSGSPDLDIRCLAMSMGQAHKAVPLTLALCLGAACQMKGTIPATLVGDKSQSLSTVTIGHASGKLDIGTTSEDGKLVSAELLRTARVLMKGTVMLR